MFRLILVLSSIIALSGCDNVVQFVKYQYAASGDDRQRIDLVCEGKNHFDNQVTWTYSFIPAISSITQYDATGKIIGIDFKKDWAMDFNGIAKLDPMESKETLVTGRITSTNINWQIKHNSPIDTQEVIEVNRLSGFMTDTTHYPSGRVVFEFKGVCSRAKQI